MKVEKNVKRNLIEKLNSKVIISGRCILLSGIGFSAVFNLFTYHYFFQGIGPDFCFVLVRDKSIWLIITG